MSIHPPKPKNTDIPKREDFQQGLDSRQRRGRVWQGFFRFANTFALFVLLLLFLNIINGVFGVVAWTYAIRPEELSERPLQELSEPELVDMLIAEVPVGQIRVLLRDTLSRVPAAEFTRAPMSQVLAGWQFDPAIADMTLNELSVAQITRILSENLTREQLVVEITERIVQPNIVRSWGLGESLLNYPAIVAERDRRFPEADLAWHSWFSWDFLTRSMATNPTDAGLRTAIIGSAMVLSVTIMFAVPVGVGAAIYLQEYATDTWLNRLIQTNIRNLSGVPSIIYGMLGLFVFVNVLQDITSGAAFGVTGANARSVLSGGLTLGLAILPVIIINAQEAIKAVPPSMREASYGLGATKWQTVSRVVVPQAFGGMLTGIILGISDAIGDTAPLLVVLGGVTFLSQDPNSYFSRTTVIPFQIFSWSFRPEQEWRSAAAAAILALLMLLLTINSVAIYLRYRFSKKRI